MIASKAATKIHLLYLSLQLTLCHLDISEGGGKDIYQGLDYYLKGCEQEYIPACYNAGRLLQSEQLGSFHNPAKALHLLQHACDQKHAASCYQVVISKLICMHVCRCKHLQVYMAA